MEPTLDEVREELAGIHDQLLALPRDDFAGRAELAVRRDELRRLSHELADGHQVSDPETLKAAFIRLQHVRDKLIEQHVSGDVGMDGAFMTAINQAIDAGTGLDEVEARIQEVLRQIRNEQ
jgi:hypothetical protein